MASGKTKPEDVGTHFRALSSIASSLNKSSDELTRTVGVLDGALKKLNIGLSSWVSYAHLAAEPPEYGSDQIGYAKIDGKWGIALRRIWGDQALGSEQEDGPWLFGDAPREMRILAVDSLPQLIEALARKAFSTAERIDDKAKQVSALAVLIDEIAKEQEGNKSRGGQ